MKKPTVYLDTTIISAYWYEGADVPSLERRRKSRDWWEAESEHFSLWISATTVNELRAGRFRRQADCLRMAQRLPRLAVRRATDQLAEDLLASRIVPAEKRGDALQLAVCTAHDIDYLLTWNYAHLVTQIVQERLVAFCRSRGIRAPLLVSPESIPSVRLGRSVRRRD